MPQKVAHRHAWTKSIIFAGVVFLIVFALARPSRKVLSQNAPLMNSSVKGQAIGHLLSTGGAAARQAMLNRSITGPRQFAPLLNPEPEDGVIPTNQLGGDPGSDPANGTGNSNEGDGGFSNLFVNDPCLDPPPTAPFPENFRRTVQSETEIAVLNKVKGASDDEQGPNDDGDNESNVSGKLMVAGYNDSYGFYNNTQGLSGFAYSTNGGKSWIDGGGLPPVVRSGAPAGTPGSDAYFGDPVVVVHHRSKTFYYSSIYMQADGTSTLAVNRGQFKVAPPQGIESKSNTRCKNDPSKYGVPDPPAYIRKRIIWEPPVVAVVPVCGGFGCDFIDKEWLYVDQRTGELYLAYVRFGAADGSTPLELMRSKDGGHTWIGPTIIVPNLIDTFNTGVQPTTTATGRVVVSWFARTFLVVPPFSEVAQRIESTYSDDDGATFGPPVVVASVNPQGEPKGYNRGRTTILNAPYIMADRGRDDGTAQNDKDSDKRGSGNVYITYFDGKTPLGSISQAADIKLSVSRDNGATYDSPVKVNGDDTQTSHVFPSVQVNQHGTVFVTWIDRRVDPVNNVLNDTWGAFSRSQGKHFNSNFRITNVSTDWFVRADARPNFGDYNSSEVIDFENFVSTWADGRFPPGTFVDRGRVRRAATPDSLFANVGNGQGDHGGNN